MRPNDVNTLLRRSLTGEITAEEQNRLDRMLSGDEKLRRQVADLLERDDLVRRYRQYAAIDSEAAKKALRMHEKPRHNLSFIKIKYAVAAVVAVAVGIFWYARQGTTPQPELSQEMAQAMRRAEQSGSTDADFVVNGVTMIRANSDSTLNRQLATLNKQEKEGLGREATIVDGTLVTKYDKEFWYTLEDGTHVHLNYDTSLKFPINFGADSRTVELTGEAYFIVAHDSRPFVVKTRDVVIRDLGTEFNVNTKEPGGNTRVALVNGRVAVSTNGGAEQDMNPGDMAIVQPGQTEAIIGQADLVPYISWNTGNYFFEDCTLEQLMRVLSHWYNKRIEFQSDDIREMRFTGNIDKYESVAPTMRAIHAVTGLRIEIDSRTIILRK